jgi:hypothetical protein
VHAERLHLRREVGKLLYSHGAREPLAASSARLDEAQGADATLVEVFQFQIFN